MRYLLLASFLGVLLHAQDAEPEVSPKPIRVDGRVTALNGDAVSGALLRLQSTETTEGSFSTTANSDGNFVFGYVAPGRYILSADKAGFVTYRYGARSAEDRGAEIVLTEGMELTSLSLRMTHLGMLFGRVTDQDGKPMARAQVSAYQERVVNGKLQLVAAGLYDGRGIADDQGNYQVSFLPSGRYYLKASPPSAPISSFLDSPSLRPALESIIIATFYPSSPDIESAVPVDVDAGGEVRGVDIRMRRERVYSIRGKAIDTDTAAPASGRSVLDAIPAPASASSIVSVSPQGSAKVGPDGSFELRNLRPGHHILQVLGAGMMWVVYGAANEIVSFSEGRSEGFSGGRSTGRLDVTITDSDVNDVVLQLVEGATLSGKVTWEDSLKSWGSRPNVRLVPNDGNTLNTPLGPIEADGTFEIEGIAPMKYSVYFGGLPAGIVVKSIRLRGEDVTGLLLDLTSGAGGSLEIVLSSK